ncbi:hypothetical protein [Amycolatopsis thermoflava]|uniref:hypothetical protein n=1 Tax=Amycolatopsis thermoflava TaxID=84480 RepID=UPI0038004EC4
MAGILSAVIGLVTYLGAQRDARQLRRDQDAFYDVQAELLDVVRKLDQAAGSRGGQPRSGDDPASVLRKRREELEKAAARLQRRKRGFATAARRLIALALVLFAVGVALNKHVAVAAVAAIHRHLLGFAEDIGLAGTPGWLLASFICGAAFAIVVLPVRIFSAREFRAELVLAPVRRKFLAAPGLSKRQKDARGMRFLEASGHNPLSGAIATFALAVAVGGASISYTGAEACDPAELTNPFCLRPVRLAGWDVLSPGLGVVADLRAGWSP